MVGGVSETGDLVLFGRQTVQSIVGDENAVELLLEPIIAHIPRQSVEPVFVRRRDSAVVPFDTDNGMTGRGQWFQNPADAAP